MCEAGLGKYYVQFWNSLKTVLKAFKNCFVSAKTKRSGRRGHGLQTRDQRRSTKFRETENGVW